MVRKVGDVNYEIEMSGSRMKIFHMNMLQKWNKPQEFSYFAAEVESPTLEDEDEIVEWTIRYWDSIPCEEVDGEPKSRILRVLHKFPDVLSKQCGRTSLTHHRINIAAGHSAIWQPPYRLPYACKDSVEKQLKEMLEEEVIEPSQSDWASPMVLVKKKDGSMKICVDYRKLNGMTHQDAYPMPRVDDILDDIGQAQYFTTLDLARGYWQVPVAEEDRQKMAFTTPFRLFQFNVMPFGLCGAPVTFQRLMDEVINGLGQFAKAYLDDIVIFNLSWEDHLRHVQVVLSRLKEAGLTVKVTKCQFAMSECTYLGYIIGGGSVKPEESKLEAINKYPIPKTKRQVRSFLGLSGYYRRFIPNYDYATIAYPLTELTRKTKPECVEWTEECSKAFGGLKQILMSEPVVACPDFSKPFILQTDASDVGVGAVLSQADNAGLDHPVAYFSRKLLAREQKYSTIEKECLAIKLGVQVFHVYFFGKPFEIQTDHRALQWLDSVKNSNSRLLRWSLTQQPYSFSIRLKKGVDNANADGLSRIEW